MLLTLLSAICIGHWSLYRLYTPPPTLGLCVSDAVAFSSCMCHGSIMVRTLDLRLEGRGRGSCYFLPYITSHQRSVVAKSLSCTVSEILQLFQCTCTSLPVTSRSLVLITTWNYSYNSKNNRRQVVQHTRLCHQAIIGTDQRAVMQCGWEDNRGYRLASHYRRRQRLAKSRAPCRTQCRHALEPISATSSHGAYWTRPYRRVRGPISSVRRQVLGIL